MIPAALILPLAPEHGQVGAAVRYSELPGLGHNVWDVAFYSAAVARWLLDPHQPAPASGPNRP